MKESSRIMSTQPETLAQLTESIREIRDARLPKRHKIIQCLHYARAG